MTQIISTTGWDQYELLDSGDGSRLERFAGYLLSRPDPQAIWQKKLSKASWDKADAIFVGVGEKGRWHIKDSFPQTWQIAYETLRLNLRLTPFKHTGIFPEQILQWEWMKQKINNTKMPQNNKPKILNLFAYTGGASLVCAALGTEVTHVDSSKPAIAWARENQATSNLADKPIRWILDDALEFIKREVRRGNKYEGIIMDPPVFGHGPNGKRWDFYTNFPELLEYSHKVLSDQAIFFLVNAYALSASSLMLKNMLKDYFLDQGKIESGELVLEEKSRQRLLSTGIFARWSR